MVSESALRWFNFFMRFIMNLIKSLFNQTPLKDFFVRNYFYKKHLAKAAKLTRDERYTKSLAITTNLVRIGLESNPQVLSLHFLNLAKSGKVRESGGTLSEDQVYLELFNRALERVKDNPNYKDYYGKYDFERSKINFVFSEGLNYMGVQEQLRDTIIKFLPGDSWSCSPSFKHPQKINITFFIRKSADIMMSHGVADKNYFFRKKKCGGYYLNDFKYAIVPGNWLKNRIINNPNITMPPENIFVVGWPRLDELSKWNVEAQAERKAGGRLRVLWAPTHNFQNKNGLTLSSYPDFEKHLDILREFCDVDISLHPRNREDKIPTGRKLAWADVVISDFGTMVYEALALNKPVLFPDWIIKDSILQKFDASSPAQLFKRNIGLHPSSIEEMVQMIKDGPKIDSVTKEYVDGIIDPSTIGKSGELIAKTLLELAEK
jgi:hypothetical protein